MLVCLAAESLMQAASLIADTRLRLDAILTDVFFDEAARCPSKKLVDGIDLLAFAHSARPEAKAYVISFFPDDPKMRQKADRRAVLVSNWFPKLYYLGRKSDSPWRRIESDLCGRPSETQAGDEYEFDVFLAHNSLEKDAVERIARDLERSGLRPWFDRWAIPPGRSFQDEISRAIPKTKAAAVFIGKDGVGPWEDLEQKAAISQFVRRKMPVIPVLLPSFVKRVEMPLFLREFSAVTFSKASSYEEALSLLIWGIKGTRTKGGRNVKGHSRRR